ncbi:MAG: hypothetical protein L0332_00615 [Chloroflexi bacterium]|nr:hypothetical protein [Chloroflexota bacterium]MCI0577588.1 hypothetical protein [Chloroflexota bacterium]MCI0644192.1 hypothetical protein [Chloroflexota bacterium]MCI0725225.1 hypothetical protein [Chloroflexota bacterium]
MKQPGQLKHRLLWFLLVLLVAVLVPAVLAANPEGGYGLAWWTADGGGATFSSGGSYAVGGTAGQPDAGRHSGGNYMLAGGFWVESPAGYQVYLPLVRNTP